MPLFCVELAISSWKRRSASSLIRISLCLLSSRISAMSSDSCRELRVVDAHRREGAGFTLDRAPGFEQLERADVLGPAAPLGGCRFIT